MQTMRLLFILPKHVSGYSAPFAELSLPWLETTITVWVSQPAVQTGCKLTGTTGEHPAFSPWDTTVTLATATADVTIHQW